LRARAEDSARPIAFCPPLPSAIAREGWRALAAFGLYLVLYPAWHWIGAPETYQAIVLKIGTAVVLATQHFPTISTLKTLHVSYLDHLPLLVLSYGLVSTRMSWGARLRRYGGLLLAILSLHTAGVVLETKIDAAQDLQDEAGLVLLLPWEFRIVDGFKYLLVDFGLTIGPFVVMLLGMAWNSGIGVSRETARPGAERRLIHLTLAVVLGLAGGGFAWSALREADARHVLTHARLGHLFFRSHWPAKAEDQYRIAMQHGATDGEAFLNLAGIEDGRGDTGEALRLLERGLEVVRDPAWRTRIESQRRALATNH